jgi:hypothetical protein
MTVTAPDATTWWDPAATTAAALDQLRLGGSDVDAARVADLVEPAGQMVNAYLDRLDPVLSPAPGPLTYAIAQVVVELYRNKDAPTTSADGFMVTSWRPGALDPLSGVRRMIDPYRQRRGIG